MKPDSPPSLSKKSLNWGGSSYFCTTYDSPRGNYSNSTLALLRLQLEPWRMSWLGLPSMGQTSPYWSKSSGGHPQGDLVAEEHDDCIVNCDKAKHIWQFSSPLLTACNRCSLLATQNVHFPETCMILMLFLIAFAFKIWLVLYLPFAIVPSLCRLSSRSFVVQHPVR